MTSSTISSVLTTITPSALSSNSGANNTSTDIVIIIGSVGFGLLILLFLIFVIALRRRSRHQKYEHPEDCSKSVIAIESSQPSEDDLHSMFNYAEADPLIATETKQKFPPSLSQYLKDTYTRPSSSSVENYSAGMATHETPIVSLDIAQSAKDNVGFEIAAFHSGRPSYSKSTIKLAPLSIPEKTLNHSKGERSHPQRTVSRKSSKPPDSGCETDDTASLYSMASASACTYFSKSSLETMKPPPVPSIPIHFPSPTQSTLPKGTDVIVNDEEKIITKSLPPLSSFLLPPLKFNGDNGEEVEDETQIYNVAKLLQSRQAKLAKDAPSRKSSIVSHIERPGSISATISPTGGKSYRPRYYRLKQKRDARNNSFASNLSPTHIPDSLSMLSTPHP
jgi:hypothetical protein